MKSWVKVTIMSVLGLASIFVAQTVFAASNPIGQAYSELGSSGVYRPTPVKANTTTSFDIFLKPNNLQEFFQQAMDVNTPDNLQFKNYLTPSDIQSKYGQPSTVTNSWKSYLKKNHLRTLVYDNGIQLTVTGKVKYIDKTFHVNMNTATYHSNPLQFGSKKPNIPSKLANTVWTVLGMTDHNRNYVMPNSNMPLVKKGNDYSFSGFTNRFVNQYDVQPLYDQGMTGKGQTIGIIAFGNIKKSNAYHFWKHENASTDMHRLTTKVIPGDMYKGNLVSLDEGETTMDVEYAGSVAPQANVRIYWVRSPYPTVMNMINAYATALNENKASSLSTSWGLFGSSYLNLLVRHKVLNSKYLDVLNFVLAQSAIQGVSSFVASGDTGALNFDVKGIAGNHLLMDRSINGNLPFDANPWITSTGGTTLPFDGNLPTKGNEKSLGKVTISSERSWGTDYIWPLVGNPDRLAQVPDRIDGLLRGSGGGFNKLTSTPTYQQGVPGVNTFNARNYVSSLNQFVLGAPLVHGTDSGRNYPDVSADADPETGYKVYYKKDGIQWPPSGGTSIVAPQYAAMTAVINSQPGRARMGFWNAQIYQLAQKSDSPFHPLNATTDNSNLYYTGQPGTVYNQASGLGTTDFAKLAEDYK